MFATDDTIVAIATPHGRGALGIVRLSGPEAIRIAAAMLDRRPALEPRRATLARVVRPAGRGVAADARAIDRVVVTSFPAPHSYTGEDSVEISAHGSPVLLSEIVASAAGAGARLARPGEFTLRAFLNGRLDLVQAEAVADLIESVTPAQARQAFDQLEGTLTAAIAELERRLFDLSARLEASVDFPEEGYHFVEPDEAVDRTNELIEAIDRLLASAARGRLVREGAHAVIAGRTNTGKSSLFNTLVGIDRAIVTPQAGTTRDLITERVDVGGVPVTLVDTAGLRVASDEVEQQGIERARGAARIADVSLVVLDRSVPLEAIDREILGRTAGSVRVVVVNKCDLPPAWVTGALGASGAVEVSLLTGAGTEALRPSILAALGLPAHDNTESAAIANVRQIDLLERAREALVDAASRASERAPEEIVLADLQQARLALEEVTGRRAPDETLEAIFDRFCIGK